MTPYHTNKKLTDIQKSKDARGVSIDQVGVCDLSYPIVVRDRENGTQHTIATISMSVNLPHHVKGTHMSRFMEVFRLHHQEINIHTLADILSDLKKSLQAEAAHIEMEFPYFLTRRAPVTGSEAKMDYRCKFVGESNGKKDLFLLSVQVPVSTLCPCSKEISDYGAHNQRGIITITVRSSKPVWIEDLIEIAEKSASAPLYPLLKRPDERYVTMQAYDNPTFVEDVVRNTVKNLKEDKRIKWFEVKAVNQESIHNHSAFAIVRSSVKTQDVPEKTNHQESVETVSGKKVVVEDFEKELRECVL